MTSGRGIVVTLMFVACAHRDSPGGEPATQPPAACVVLSKSPEIFVRWALVERLPPNRCPTFDDAEQYVVHVVADPAVAFGVRDVRVDVQPPNADFARCVLGTLEGMRLDLPRGFPVTPYDLPISLDDACAHGHPCAPVPTRSNGPGASGCEGDLDCPRTAHCRCAGPRCLFKGTTPRGTCVDTRSAVLCGADAG